MNIFTIMLVALLILVILFVAAYMLRFGIVEWQLCRRHVNPDGTLGGYVAVRAYASPDSYIGRHARVLDYSQAGYGTRLLEESTIRNKAVVDGSTLRDRSTVRDSAFVSCGATLRGNTDLGGNSDIRGAALIVCGTYRDEVRRYPLKQTS